MRQVVTAVPGVEPESPIEANLAQLRMAKGAGVVRVTEPFKEVGPALVQARKQQERGLDRRRGGVGEFGPGSFLVRLDEWRIFSERQPEARVAINMTVGQVMDDLAHGPTTGTVGRGELRFAETRDGLPQLSRECFELGNPGSALLWSYFRRRLIAADRVAKIFGAGNHTILSNLAEPGSRCADFL
jgi:hypothetical protein